MGNVYCINRGGGTSVLTSRKCTEIFSGGSIWVTI